MNLILSFSFQIRCLFCCWFFVCLLVFCLFVGFFTEEDSKQCKVIDITLCYESYWLILLVIQITLFDVFLWCQKPEWVFKKIKKIKKIKKTCRIFLVELCDYS